MKRIAILSICLAALSAAARPWPDSSTQIVAFADQLPGSLNETQRWFAATKLAGTQKQLRSEIRAIRAYNTNFLCLHYQLAVGCGPELFIDGDGWTSDWAAVSSRTNWFLLNDRTQRVHQTHWNWDVMDVTYSSGAANTAFPQYWITTCLARIRSAEDDAVFADSYTQDACSFGQCSPSHAWLEDVDACSTGWVPNLERFGVAVTNAFAADGGGFLFLPNLGGLITGWDPMNYGVGDGGMIEGFCFWDSWSAFDESDWALQMNRALSLVRSNKIVICQSSPATWDIANRMFATASYLLIKGTRTYLNLLTTGDIALEYYPEYTIRLGGTLSNAAPAMTNLWHGSWGVYRRDYTNGIVLVNPGASARNIASLGTNYLLVSAAGGGYVDDHGDYGGSLSYASITSLNMAAYSGAVLLRSGADCDGDGANNREEALAGTDLMDASSLFRLSDIRVIGTNVVVRWTSCDGKSYRLGRSTDLVHQAQGTYVRTNVAAAAPVNSATDNVSQAVGPWLYRIELE